MVDVVDATATALAAADPKRAADYRANARSYRDDLRALDAEYRAGLADCARRVIVTSHDAFGYLADAYDLKQQSVNGLSPDAEPNPKRLGELADLARDKGITTVFSEDLVSPRVARTVAREAGGLRIETLSPLEGLTAKQQKAGGDYLSVMGTNLKKLRRALDCT
jgi:zinc transport system substrate-binding protein